MKTNTLFSVFIFLISLTLVGSFFKVEGLNQDLPTASALTSSLSGEAILGDPFILFDLVSSLIPSPTGVQWFDLMIFAGFSLMLVIAGAKFIRGIS